MQNYLIDAANRRWTIRRTCVDTPGRAYALQLHVHDIDVRADVLPGVIGFYAETIDDAKHQLGVA